MQTVEGRQVMYGRRVPRDPANVLATNAIESCTHVPAYKVRKHGVRQALPKDALNRSKENLSPSPLSWCATSSHTDAPLGQRWLAPSPEHPPSPQRPVGAHGHSCSRAHTVCSYLGLWPG